MKEGNEMTKIDIISGFLGAGKTTLIQKLIKEVYAGKKVVLVENEFGEIGIDGGFLKDAGIVVNEINSGCICCTLQGDFRNALQEVVKKYNPDHIIIEPSGVGKLSDILAVVKDVEGLELNSYSTVVDAKRCEIYHKNFKEFFDDQISTAACVILSRTQLVDEETLQKDIAIIRELNHDARIITTPWDDLSGQAIIEAMEGSTDGFPELEEEEECCCCGCGCHDDDDDCFQITEDNLFLSISSDTYSLFQYSSDYIKKYGLPFSTELNDLTLLPKNKTLSFIISVAD